MNAKTARNAAALLAVSGLILLAGPASAFRMIQNTATGRVTAGFQVACSNTGGFAHWMNDGTINWFHNTGNQGANMATPLQNAMAAWNNSANTNHNLTYAGTTTDGWATDGRNTVLWATGNGCTGNCLALTALVLQYPQVIVETDVTFNDSYTWNTNGTDYDVQAVAAHELGHTLGIHHTELTSTPRPTMYATYFGTDGRTLESDDESALSCIQTNYPLCTGGIPPVPPKVNVYNDVCWGSNTVEWSDVCGATYFELYRSSSSSFTSQTLVYSGPSTSEVVNVTSATYVRVRACNAYGCSGYRNGDKTAKYYNGCL